MLEWRGKSALRLDIVDVLRIEAVSEATVVVVFFSFVEGDMVCCWPRVSSGIRLWEAMIIG